MRDRIARLVISNPAPPVPGCGSNTVIDDTCPYIEPVSMFKKAASMPPSCFMRALLTSEIIQGNSSG